MRVGAYDGSSGETTRESNSGEGYDPMVGDRRASEHLTPDENGQCSDGATDNLKTKEEKVRKRALQELGRLTDRVVALWTGEKVDRSFKIMLRYDTILKLWTEELFCTRVSIEVSFEPSQRYRNGSCGWGGWRMCLHEFDELRRDRGAACLGAIIIRLVSIHTKQARNRIITSDIRTLMSARAPELLQSNKALPSIAKESLPKIPRLHLGDNFSLPPQPPPKQFPDQEKPPHANGQHSLVIDVGLSNGSSGQGI
jgi:hypothetical protein